MVLTNLNLSGAVHLTRNINFRVSEQPRHQHVENLIVTSTNGNTKPASNHQNQDNTILIKNLKDNETLTYSLALIIGQVPPSNNNHEFVRVRNHHSPRKSQSHKTTEWPIVNGDFRALVELKKGPNLIELEVGNIRRSIAISYESRATRLRVTPVYVICSGHDGYFQGPAGENRTPESAALRIGLGARLLQTLTAEKLSEAGHGRRTFQLERDLDGAECLVMQSQLDVHQARAMSQRELWEIIGRELMSGPLASKDRKYLAFLSCTRYRGAPSPRTHEDTLARTQGHAALGGGGLALFGSACLHTWPTSMDEVLPRFLDTTTVDTERLMDDSNYRGTHGGCLATTLGSVLHELGHTFDLGHTREGIMGRGFDYVDRVFVGAAGIDPNRNHSIRGDPQHTTIALSRPLSVTVTVQGRSAAQTPTTATASTENLSPRRSRLLSENSRVDEQRNQEQTSSVPGRLSAPASPELNRSFTRGIKDHLRPGRPEELSDRTFWGASCAALLAYHKWFSADKESARRQNKNDIQFDEKRNVVTSRNGIRVVELRESSGGMVVASRQYPGERLILEAMIPTPTSRCSAALTLVAEDSLGCILKYALPSNF